MSVSPNVRQVLDGIATLEARIFELGIDLAKAKERIAELEGLLRQMHVQRDDAWMRNIVLAADLALFVTQEGPGIKHEGCNYLCLPGGYCNKCGYYDKSPDYESRSKAAAVKEQS